MGFSTLDRVLIKGDQKSSLTTVSSIEVVTPSPGLLYWDSSPAI